MKRLVIVAAVLLLAACVGEPPAPLALPPPPATEPAPSPATSIDTPPSAPAEPAAPTRAPASAARPPQSGHGPWCVVVASERKAGDTKPWMRRLADAGFKVDVEPAEVGGTRWYRVMLPGYRAAGEARAALQTANEAAHVKDSFIARCAQKTAETAPAN